LIVVIVLSCCCCPWLIVVIFFPSCLRVFFLLFPFAMPFPEVTFLLFFYQCKHNATLWKSLLHIYFLLCCFPEIRDPEGQSAQNRTWGAELHVG